jgi:hypothetical protein
MKLLGEFYLLYLLELLSIDNGSLNNVELIFFNLYQLKATIGAVIEKSSLNESFI